MGDYNYEEHDAGISATHVDQMVAVYLLVHAGEPGSFAGESRFRQQVSGHMKAPGWKAITAHHDSKMVGFAYGFPLGKATRWWEGLIGEVPPTFRSETGTRTFAISELNVIPSQRNRGIAAQLYHRLLAGRPEERATLLVRPGNTQARQIYSHWGWEEVARLKPDWENSPTFEVLIKCLKSSNAEQPA